MQLISKDYSVSSEDSLCGSIPSLGALGGLDLDFRVRPAAAPAAWKSENLEILEFGPFGIRLKKPAFRTAWDMTNQSFRDCILTFRDLDRHFYLNSMRVAGWGI